ncbi:MAG: threonine/serine dehydratase [Xanthobacteraceae bacterium]|nr:threonine/serine dehydratase [Xanthobacteraceae bacterium]
MVGPDDAITPQAIARCEQVIRPYIRRTPVITIDGSEFGAPAGPLTLKLELLQHSGVFKDRGAFSNLLTREIPAAGIVAASGGNHGAAVAYAARRLGKLAKIFVPSISSPAKIARIREYGADLTVGGDGYAEALAASERFAEQTGAMQVRAFDQYETIIGQGTLALELEAQAPDIDTLLVSVGGGGLVAGIAAWYAGRIKVIGVEPSASPTLTRALEAGRPVDADVGGLAADSLAPRRVGERVFPIAQKYVHRTVLVTDDAIAEAQWALWRALRIVAEPGGACAFSAISSGAYRPAAGERVAVVISGGNTTAVNFDLKR